jgi:hypothetical protein
MAEFAHPLQSQVVQPGLLVTEGYEIRSITVDGDRATVDVTVRSRLKHPMFSKKEREVRLEQPWVKYRGRWYLEPQPIGLADSIRKRRGTWKPPGQQPVETEGSEATPQSSSE